MDGSVKPGVGPNRSAGQRVGLDGGPEGTAEERGEVQRRALKWIGRRNGAHCTGGE